MPKVKRHELEKCVGNPRKRCGRPADPGIKGHDGKWRCLPCNKIHVELVYLEAGSSQVNASEADNFVPAVTEQVLERKRRERGERGGAKRQRVEVPTMSQEEFERRRAMIGRYGRSGGSTVANPYSRGPAHVEPDEIEDQSHRLAAATSRREAILAKYGRASR
jgi:hypothetical protein